MKHGSWTVTFADKRVIKRCDEFDTSSAFGIEINDDTFWSQSKFDGLRAIQFTNDNTDNDQVETDTGNVSYDASTLGSFQQFVDKFDAAYLAYKQDEWDNDNVEGETEAEKITRLGARLTSYTSTPI